MAGHTPKRTSPGASFSWHGAFWTAAMGGGMYVLHSLRDYHMLTDGQIVLLILIAVPAAAALLSLARGERSNGRGGGGRDADP